MNGADDAVLAAAAAAGDHSAFEKLHARYVSRVLRIARAILWGRCVDPYDHARDVAQEVWRKIVQSAGQYASSEGSFKGWLSRIATNASKDHISRSCDNRLQSLEALDEKSLLGDKPADDVEALVGNRMLLQSIVKQLSPDEQVLTELVYVQELGNKELSQVLNIDENTAKQRTFRLRQKLYKLGRQI